MIRVSFLGSAGKWLPIYTPSPGARLDAVKRWARERSYLFNRLTYRVRIGRKTVATYYYGRLVKK